MFRFVDWPFEDRQFPRQLGATVMRSVLSGDRPALEVVHFPDGDWGIADGVDDPNAEGAVTATHIWHVLEQDATLLSLATLAPGHVARRPAVGEAWSIYGFEWDED